MAGLVVLKESSNTRVLSSGRHSPHSHNSKIKSARTWNKSATKGGLKAATKGAADCFKEAANCCKEAANCCKGGRRLTGEQSATLRRKRNMSVRMKGEGF
jgi:hypothetical protein